jgi:hypothetical protein
MDFRWDLLIKYLLSADLTAEESISVTRSQHFLGMLKASTQSLDYNGRVIIAAHEGSVILNPYRDETLHLRVNLVLP